MIRKDICDEHHYYKNKWSTKKDVPISTRKLKLVLISTNPVFSITSTQRILRVLNIYFWNEVLYFKIGSVFPNKNSINFRKHFFLSLSVQIWRANIYPEATTITNTKTQEHPNFMWYGLVFMIRKRNKKWE